MKEKEIPELLMNAYNKKLKTNGIENLKAEIITLGKKIYNEIKDFIDQHGDGLYCEEYIYRAENNEVWKSLRIIRTEDRKVDPWLQSYVKVEFIPFKYLIEEKLGYTDVIQFSVQESAYNRFRQIIPTSTLSDIKNYKTKYLEFFKKDKDMRKFCTEMMKKFGVNLKRPYIELYDKLVS